MHLRDTRKSRYTFFACKHDGHHKARLVAGGHLTPDPIDSIYSGVVSNKILNSSNIPGQIEQYGSLGSRHWQCIPRSHDKRNIIHSSWARI